VAGPLTVSPAGGLTSSGTIGGPFSPTSQTYTLTNTGTASMNWTASKVQSWVTLSAAAGTLAVGAATTTVTASINSGANSLAAGSYSDNVTFTNTTNNTGNTTRPVSLTVNATEAPTISTVSLPAGAVDYGLQSDAGGHGGTTPYSWSVSVGTLPAGLSLSPVGVLSGTPTTAESSSFTVRWRGRRRLVHEGLLRNDQRAGPAPHGQPFERLRRWWMLSRSQDRVRRFVHRWHTDSRRPGN